MKFDYYLLKDSKFNGFVVKKNQESREEFYFNRDTKQWEPIGIMMNYFWPDSDRFEMYDELSLDELNEIGVPA